MSRAIGLAIILIVMAVLLPRVFAATERFLLVLLEKATVVVESIEAQPASLLQTLP